MSFENLPPLGVSSRTVDADRLPRLDTSARNHRRIARLEDVDDSLSDS